MNDQCASCRGRTAGLFAGGETLTWARDAYCSSSASFGADGDLVFLGGTNDDLLSGVLSLARLFVVGNQGPDAWHRNLPHATAAALSQFDAQASGLTGLMHCAYSRRAHFLFLQDFLVSDIAIPRDRNRAAMLARRRAIVEKANGTFIDLLDAFRGQVGVSWFNDYIHLSLIGHQRVADLACQRLQ